MCRNQAGPGPCAYGNCIGLLWLAAPCQARSCSRLAWGHTVSSIQGGPHMMTIHGHVARQDTERSHPYPPRARRHCSRVWFFRQCASTRAPGLIQCFQRRRRRARRGCSAYVSSEGDIHDRVAVNAVMASCERVYHLAAQSTVVGAVSDVDYSFPFNAIGTYPVLSCSVLCRRSGRGVQRVVFTFSARASSMARWSGCRSHKTTTWRRRMPMARARTRQRSSNSTNGAN